MGIMVYSGLWVMHDFSDQPCLCGNPIQVEVSTTQGHGSVIPKPQKRGGTLEQPLYR